MPGIAVGPMPVHEMSEEQMHRQIAVNQISMLYGFKYAAAAHAPAQAGVDHQLASMQAHVGVVGWTAYAGTKGAAIAMTQQLAVEFAPFGIRVNCISPGAINTPMNAKIVAEQGEQAASDLEPHASPRPHRGAERDSLRQRCSWLRTPPRRHRRGPQGRWRRDASDAQRSSSGSGT